MHVLEGLTITFDILRTNKSKGEIDLGDDDPMLVKLLFDYLYQLDYDDNMSRTDALPVVHESDMAHSPEIRIVWDHGLEGKYRKRTEKAMRLEGTWNDRVTQEMVDADHLVPQQVKEAHS